MSQNLFDKLIIFLYTSYHQIKQYFYFKNFEKKHLSYGFVDGKFQITSTNHDDYIAAIQKNINNLAKNNNRKDFIRQALTLALDGCNFIIFSPAQESNLFVQYWTGDHQLKYNFYTNKANKLKKYYLSTIGLLSEMGFVNDTTPDYRGFKVFKIDKGTDYISVDTNFKKDIDSATEFTETIYKEIYKIKAKKLVAKVE